MGVASIFLLRRLLSRVVPAEKVAQAEAVLPFLVGTIGGYYGLLTGFILSTAWGDVQSVRSASMVEINALVDLERIAMTLPSGTGEELSRAVDAYVRSVIDYDVQALAEGRIGPQTTTAYGHLWSIAARSASGTTSREAELLGRALDKVETIGEQRRTKIQISSESLPPIVWAILIIGATIILYGATIVSLRYGRPALEVLAAVAAMLVVVLFTIYAMDRPFRHGAALGIEGYERLWEALQAVNERPASADGQPFPARAPSARRF